MSLINKFFILVDSCSRFQIFKCAKKYSYFISLQYFDLEASTYHQSRCPSTEKKICLYKKQWMKLEFHHTKWRKKMKGHYLMVSLRYMEQELLSRKTHLQSQWKQWYLPEKGRGVGRKGEDGLGCSCFVFVCRPHLTAFTG